MGDSLVLVSDPGPGVCYHDVECPDLQGRPCEQAKLCISTHLPKS